MNQFDTILLGRKTYDAMRSQKGAGGGMPGMTTYLFSRTLKPKDHPDVIVVSDNAPQVLNALKKQPGKDIWLFGGGGLFASLLDAAVVDAIEVAVIPVMLGAGRPLLPSGKRTKLQLTNQRIYKKTGTVLLEYAVTAPASRAASPSR
jgi:dihydrofolate reductase